MAERGAGGGGVRTREETRTRLTRTSGVGVGSLESPPSPHPPALGDVPLLLLHSRWGLSPQLPVSGEGIPDYRPESPAIKPLGCPPVLC